MNGIYVYFAMRVNEWSSDLLMIDLLLDGVYHSRNDWIGIYVYIDLFLVEFSFKNSCINFFPYFYHWFWISRISININIFSWFMLSMIFLKFEFDWVNDHVLIIFFF